MELVISSQSGGRIYDSSAALDMHTYSLCTFTFDNVDDDADDDDDVVVVVMASGEYLASKLYGFVVSTSGYDVLLKLHSLP